MTVPSPVHDPAVYVSYFFVLPSPFEKTGMTKFGLEGLLTQAVREVAETAPPEPVSVKFPPVWESRRLCPVVRKQQPDEEEELEVRTLHDTVSLRTGKVRKRTLALGPQAVLPARDLPYLETASTFLGKLTAHTAEADPGTTDADLLLLAEQFAKECKLPGGASPRFSLPIGALVIGPLGESTRMVFVYRRGQAVEFAFQMTLQELFLCHLKVRNAERNLRAYHLPQAKEQDEHLRQHIAATHPNRLRLGQLQKANDDLTTIRADLVTSICSIENELRTVEVARENFTHALQGSAFEPEARRLTDVLIDHCAIPLRNQALVDVGYRKATRERATVHFESLDATIDVHDAKQTHLLAIVMAALTCAQVAGLVAVVAGSNFATWHWGLRLGSVIGATGVLSVLSWLLIRRR
jgi:hypothetical protein